MSPPFYSCALLDIFMYVRQDDCTALANCLNHANNSNAATDVDLMDENGNTPLLVAARLGHPKSFRLLLQHGADAMHVNRMGGYLVLVALTSKSAPLPLSAGSNCSITRFPIFIHLTGINAMTLAAFSGNMDIIAMLLNHSSLDYYCKTTFIPPICAATIAGHERVVQWFCDTFQKPKPEHLPKTIEGGWIY